MVLITNGSPSLGIVLIRVTLGILLVLNAWSHITAEGGIPNLVAGSDLSSPVFTWWGKNLVQQHPAGTSTLIVTIELIGGVCFVLGALVRPLGILLAFTTLCFAATAGRPFEEELAILAGVCALGCSLSGAGRLFGLDSMFDQNFPRWITWAGTQQG